MADRVGEVLKRVGASLAAIGALGMGIPADLALEPAIGIASMINAVLPALWSVMLIVTALLGLTLSWSKGARAGRELGVALGFLALMLGLLADQVGRLGPFLQSGGIEPAIVALAGALAAAGSLRFAATFPEPLTVADVSRSLQLKKTGADEVPDPTRGVRVMYWLMAYAWPFQIAVGSVAASAAYLGGVVAVLGSILWLACTGLVGLMAVTMTPQFHKHLDDALARRRIQWVALGLGWGMACVSIGLLVQMVGEFAILGGPLGEWTDTPAPVIAGVAAGLLLADLCIAGSVFFEGVFDPRLALQRTTIYGGTMVALVILFATLEELLSAFVTSLFGLPDVAAGVLAGLAVAGAFLPVQRTLKGWAQDDPPATAKPAASKDP